MNTSDASLAALYAVRIGVGICSTLSIVGAFTIILSYSAFPELRTIARQFLLNLSIADLVLSLAFIFGLIQNAKTFDDPYDTSSTTNASSPYWLCEVQAFFIIFCSDASILWTISVGIYFFVTIALQRPRHAKRLLPVFYLVSWGVPLSIVMWLLLTHSLGYEPGSDPAFCGILSTVEKNGKQVDADYPIILGFEGWHYLAFIILPILFISTLIQNKRMGKTKKDTNGGAESLESLEVSSSISSSTSSFKYTIRLSEMPDKRVVIVPVVYMLLNFWKTGVDIGIYFISRDAKTTYRENTLSSVLIFISGIGSSLPGFVHGLLFCVLTKEVRNIMIKGIWRGLTNCEVCIYDRSCTPSCYKKRSDNSIGFYSNHSYVRPIITQEMMDTASLRFSIHDSVLQEDEVVEPPDPTTQVAIVQGKYIPQFPEHFQDNFEVT